MLGLMDPDSGSIKINGNEITNFSEEQFYQNNRKIGMLFQNGALFDSVSVWENVAFSRYYGIKGIRIVNPEDIEPGRGGE